MKIRQHHELADAYAIELANFRSVVHPDHFVALNDDTAARRLFKMAVRRVAVEISAYCNRTCRFCPNAAGSRLHNRNVMSDAVFTDVLDALVEIDFDGQFAFHQYNEPLACRDYFMRRLRQVTEALQGAKTLVTTNGDFLNADYLADLKTAGLKHLNISIYGPRNGEFCDYYIVRRMRTLLAKLDLAADWVCEEEGVRYEARANCGALRIDMIAANYNDGAGYNRGELVVAGPDVRRTSPCFAPFREVNIDWRGQLIPCCNVYPDEPSHREYVCGDLRSGTGLFRAYAGAELARWRRALLRFYPEGSPCGTCSRLDCPSANTVENRALLADARDRLIGEPAMI